MKLIQRLAQSEKVLLFVLILQVTIYWVCIIGTEGKSAFVAYQQF